MEKTKPKEFPWPLLLLIIGMIGFGIWGILSNFSHMLVAYFINDRQIDQDFIFNSISFVLNLILLVIGWDLCKRRPHALKWARIYFVILTGLTIFLLLGKLVVQLKFQTHADLILAHLISSAIAISLIGLATFYLFKSKELLEIYQTSNARNNTFPSNNPL